ncbi:MAG: thiopurine S-methyltransferase [Balneolaceae bacterium]|nr:thiopurine S-methyltransferase [Balneolaceae bacterium]
MDQSYWLDRWTNKQIGFDQLEPNPLLQTHFDKLNLDQRSTVFVPLTGKNIDVAWLLDQGYRVVGCELSELAVRELFDLLDLKPTITDWKYGKVFSNDAITIFVGDFFELSTEDIGQIDGIYDRASMVALPDDMRKDYAQHLLSITKRAPQLLIVFDYEQELVPGPPFSISEDEIESHYSNVYSITILEKRNMTVGIKGTAPATENAWLLTL